MTCLLLMNKDLFSLLGWNNIFDVNTNSDHVPQREINGRDIYFPQECPDLWPSLRGIPYSPEDLMFWTLMDRRVVRFFSWLSESFLPIPSLPELQRLPTSQLIKHFLCLPLSLSPDLILSWQFLYLLPKLNLANLISHLLSALNSPLKLSRKKFKTKSTGGVIKQDKVF